MTLSKAYAVFKLQYPGFTHCQRTFEGLKPVHVRCAKKEMRARCCCLVHVSTELLVNALKKVHVSQKLEAPKCSAGDLLRASYCLKREVDPFHKVRCILRECEECPGIANVLDPKTPVS